MKLKSPHHARYRLSIGLWGIEVTLASKSSTCTIGAKNIPICIKFVPLIAIDIGWLPVISAGDCHLIHSNDISLLLTAATKHLLWKLFCKRILSENFLDELSSGRVFQVRFAIFFGTSFPNTASWSAQAKPTLICPVARQINPQLKRHYISRFVLFGLNVGTCQLLIGAR